MPGEFTTRRIAIYFSARIGVDKFTRWQRVRIAWAALWSILPTTALINWLCVPEIPTSVKVRECLLAPWKMAKFLTGFADEAAILDHRSK